MARNCSSRSIKGTVGGFLAVVADVESRSVVGGTMSGLTGGVTVSKGVRASEVGTVGKEAVEKTKRSRG